MPLLLNVVEIVEVAALPLLVKVPWLFTAAVVPLSLPPRFGVTMFNPLLVVWSLNVAPLPIVKIPEPGSLSRRSDWSIQRSGQTFPSPCWCRPAAASARHPARNSLK